jgi:hypothetical protein
VPVAPMPVAAQDTELPKPVVDADSGQADGAEQEAGPIESKSESIDPPSVDSIPAEVTPTAADVSPSGASERWWVLALLPLAALGGWVLGRRSFAVPAEEAGIVAEAPWRLTDTTTGEELILVVQRGGIDCVLGRHDVDVLVTGNSVSRRHAQLLGTRETLEVRDLGSMNGTFVNDRPCEAGVAVVIVDGDRLRFGDREFVLTAVPGAAP